MDIITQVCYLYIYHIIIIRYMYLYLFKPIFIYQKIVVFENFRIFVYMQKKKYYGPVMSIRFSVCVSPRPFSLTTDHFEPNLKG